MGTITKYIEINTGIDMVYHTIMWKERAVTATSIIWVGWMRTKSKTKNHDAQGKGRLSSESQGD